MGIPIPVYASPTVSRMVIRLEWLKEACMCIRGLHVPLVSRMVIQLNWQGAGENHQSAFLTQPSWACPSQCMQAPR